jgi:hypothetical protein
MFGCAYDGLPAVPSPTLRLIGANVSVRARFMLHMAACRLKVSDADRAVLVMRSPPLT